jgi:hypothetical protein
MKKIYAAPTLTSHRLQLGVFGNYGDGDGGSGGDIDPPAPIRVIDRFQLHMD